MCNKQKFIFLGIIILTVFGIYSSQKPKKSVENSNLDTVINQSEERMTPTMISEPSVPPKNTNLPKPDMMLAVGKTYTAKLSTSEGEIEIMLYADKTPITVNNFVYLARQNFYDGTIFHRVIKGFMIQGGDPEGTGRGGPGYRFEDERFEGSYTRGTVAMANAGPNTNGSQFFIMHQDYPLTTDYVIFGKVTSGMEIVDKIATAETGAADRPVAPQTIQKVEIVEE